MAQPPAHAPDSAPSEARRLVASYRAHTSKGAVVADGVLVAAALILFAIQWPTFHLTHFAPPVWWPILAAMGTFPLAAARVRPVSAWCVAAVAAVVVALVPHASGYPLAWPVAQFVALLGVVVVSLMSMPGNRLWAAAPITICLSALNPTADSQIGWAVGFAVLVGFVLLVRWLTSSRRELAVQEARVAEQRGLRTVAEEKARLARDLHDVVAHQMSMIVVQAQSAPYRLKHVTPGIHAEFDSIAGTAREALDEIRGLLGVLRGDEEHAQGTAPVGADQLVPTLVAARAAGIDLAWTIEGGMDLVDETTGVVLHRVLQESLSNAARHAPGGPVQVSLRIATSEDPSGPEGRAAVVLDVTNGPGTPGALPSPETTGGSGIAGMAARVGAVGGTFTAVPESDGGFTVTACVPLRRR